MSGLEGPPTSSGGFARERQAYIPVGGGPLRKAEEERTHV